MMVSTIARETRAAARLFRLNGYVFRSAKASDNVRIADITEHEAVDLKKAFGGTVSYSDRLGWNWTATHRRARRFLATVQAVQA